MSGVMLLHQLADSLHELINYGIVAFSYIIDDAALDVSAEKLLIEGMYGGAYSRRLLQYIVAVGVIVEHRDEPSDLPLDAPEPVDESLLLSVIAVCGAYSAGGDIATRFRAAAWRRAPS